MKNFNSLLILFFSIIVVFNSSQAVKLDLTQINQIFNLVQKFQSNLTHIIKDENFQEQTRNALKTFLANVTNEEHKQLIENILPLLPQLLSANGTTELQNLIKPFLKQFDFLSLFQDSKNTFNELLSSSLNYANEIFGSHDTKYYLQHSESFLKRVITKLFASKEVQEALKKLFTSAERAFGKIDLAKMLQQMQSGYSDVLVDPQVQEMIQKSLNQFKDIFLSEN